MSGTEECSGPTCPVERAQKQAQEAGAKALAETGCVDCENPGTAALAAGNAKHGHARG